MILRLDDIVVEGLSSSQVVKWLDDNVEIEKIEEETS